MSPGKPEDHLNLLHVHCTKKNQGSKKFEILVYSGVDQAVRGKGAEHSDDLRAPAGAARNAGSTPCRQLSRQPAYFSRLLCPGLAG